MAKIAVELQRALRERAVTGAPGRAAGRVVASGSGWSATDVVCTSGPHDRTFEERHEAVCVALVVAGTFQYRTGSGRELLAPGALLLGNSGHCFECGHEHGTGDRCLSFAYAPDFFERVAVDAGGRAGFHLPRVPPLKALSPLAARACGGLIGGIDLSWEELAVQFAATAVRLAQGLPATLEEPAPGAVARVNHTVRAIEEQPDADWSLQSLAEKAGLSPYHFLRTFQAVTGVTPHQYVLRTRLRLSALRLVSEPTNIITVALESGFGDVSNFNRAFRSEFGISPRRYRASFGTESVHFARIR